jgi:ATP-dependent Lon protease
VGKTSLGQSVAKALGRKFARVSLGGVRDDAEIRGHRRTYIGAMPGRVIQALKRAGERNPVLMLDEVDKLSRGYSGDPAAALLEVLDPEQNSAFLDHYLDVPFDLSQVLFVCTANSVEGIPGPLLDRMEVIDLSGYTTAEKLHIARNHLLPKQFAEHGVAASGELEISDPALLRLITHHTREAGVRELQRKAVALIRASSEKLLTAKAENKLPVRVELEQLEDLIGPERFTHEVAERVAPPGVVTGLAWTPQGGEILFIESGQMQGTGKLTLTGQLGEVMKESAVIALSLLRSRLPGELPAGFSFEKSDLHVHVPAGAIPKDGPSAGVTMLTALASLLTGRRVNPKLAMTGEITLRGAVTPVGGIKEKVLAAHRAGIETVLLPKRNEKDLREVPEEVRSQLKIRFMETAADVLREALSLELMDPLANDVGKPVGSGASVATPGAMQAKGDPLR